MCDLNPIILKAILGLFVLSLLQPSTEASPYKEFDPDQYPDSNYRISKTEFQYGDTLIQITEVKNISGKFDRAPRHCRAWIDVVVDEKTTFQKYFGDISPAGFSFGLSIPKSQPSPPYFAVVKNGDYDGRLYLIHENGEVFDLFGGFYFFSNNKRYLFSNYASDISGLAVFDLRDGRVVYSSDKSLKYQHQWYQNNDSYFFTASQWLDNSGSPSENTNVGYFYDFESHNIVRKDITKKEVEASNPIEFEFDPRFYNDCDPT